jgi:signal transduction histidine kinase
MAGYVSCPNCEQPVDPQARTCEHCGVDLAVAAAVAESNVRLPEPLGEGVVMTPEILVPRLGDYLLEMGFIKIEDLERALAYQRDMAQQGRGLLLGQVLRELDLVDDQTLDQVITEQILGLQAALKQSNRQLEQRVQERTQELQKALEKLTELNQLKANFIANISHELRTPLAHIKGYLDILAEDGFGSLSESQRGAVEVLRRAEARLERLIENLIQFSLATRGELFLSMAPTDLREIVSRAVDEAMPKASANHVSLTQKMTPAVLVSCDEEKIHWVISQLLDNALKFTPKGGRVEVEIIHNGKLAALLVKDTGIGIPADRLNEIFAPFHQLDGSATRRYGGTGLGLALCNRIIEAHKSKIEVQSIQGKGSVFSFSLPVV